MVLRLSAAKLHKLDGASEISIAAQASIAPFGLGRWYEMVGAKKRCAECTYLRLSPLSLRTQAFSV